MNVPAALGRAAFPAPVLDVLRTLTGAGHRSWLVGGAVRDLLLRRPRTAGDFDVATPARPDEVMRLFRKVIPTGVEHGTVTVLARGEPIEVTTFRGEGAYRDGRRPESVVFLQDLEADLARRDFTINALAFDPLAPEFRDPFGGRDDLRRRRVRAVGDPAARFAEDGLRPMRAVRFVAQLGFGLDPTTRRSIPGALDVVRLVAAERLTDELGKLLVARHALDALRLLRSTGLLRVVLPAVAALPPRTLEHAEGVAGRVAPDLAARLAAVLHPLGADGARKALSALRFPRQVSDSAEALVRFYPCRRTPGGALPASDPAAIRRWLSRVEPRRVEALLFAAAAEARGLPPSSRRRAGTELARVRKRVTEVLRSNPPLAIRDLALDGRDVAEVLGAAPGPRVGEALRHLLDRVLQDPRENDPERLRAALREWSSQGAGRI